MENDNLLRRELEYISRDDLMKAALLWGIDFKNKKFSDNLLDLLAVEMNSEEKIKKIIGELNELERDFLGLLLLNRGAMIQRDLRVFARKYSSGKLTATEKSLRNKGLIYRRIIPTRTEYVSSSVEYRVISKFIPYLKELLERYPAEEDISDKIENTDTKGNTMLVDLVQFASYLDKNKIKLSMSFEYPKKHLDKIKAILSEQTDERFEKVDRYARRAEVYFVDNKNYVNLGDVISIFSGPQEFVALRFVKEYLGRSRSSWSADETSAEQFLNIIVCRLRQKTNTWITIDNLVKWIKAEVFRAREGRLWIQIEKLRIIEALKLFYDFGIIEYGFVNDELYAIQVTDFGKNVLFEKADPSKTGRLDAFIVRPDFEIIVFSNEIDLVIQFLLARFTEPKSTDVVCSYKLTEDTVFSAIEQGISVKNILSFLEKYSRRPIPNNVKRTIEGWASKALSAKISTVTILETESERDMINILSFPFMKKYFVRKLSPTAIIIQGDITQLSKELRKKKCSINLPEEESTKIKIMSYTPKLIIKESRASIPESCKDCPAADSCFLVFKRDKKWRLPYQ